MTAAEKAAEKAAAEKTTKTLVVNGNTYTTANENDLSNLGGKIFSAGDGMKQGDKISFAPDVVCFKTSGKIAGIMREWLAVPCMVERNGKTFESVISISTLTGSGYTTPNPESGTQKNVPYNSFIQNEISGLSDGKQKINAILSALRGKTFTVNRVDFHAPKEWIDTTEKKENGEFRKTPKLSVVGDKMVILTNSRTVSQLG